MKLKEITMEKAITSPGIEMGKVCMLVAISSDTTIAELNFADAFYLIEDDEKETAVKEEPEPTPIDEISEELMSLDAIPEDVYEEPVEEKKPKKSKYDLPKIQALLNAGWGVKQIALEFGVSSETMSKYIHYRRTTGDIK